MDADTDETVRRPRVYATSGTRFTAFASIATGIIFFLVALAGGRAHGVWFAAAAVMLLLAWRAWMVGIRVSSDGVTIANVVLSRRVPWDDIDHFAVMPMGRHPYVGHVVLRDGRSFGTLGIASSPRQNEAGRLRVQRPIDELNAVLAERRAAGVVGPAQS